MSAARGGGLRTLVALLVVALALVLPASAGRLDGAHFLRLPVELPVFLLLAALLPAGRAGRLLVIAAAVLAALSVVMRLADIGAGIAFARPFNPVLDIHLVGAGWNLLSGSIGTVGAAAPSAERRWPSSRSSRCCWPALPGWPRGPGIGAGPSGPGPRSSRPSASAFLP
ncbi:hypothetical protein [Methylobrevis pamukkalensis]|uniref:Uncharacterized protein n=1 Tax=Methylobrevis pamukkalensis TaxID=1439726 RepID=A0A1E3H638_9HYPH|nr:hypothetical protein [Methylobrevis pamukkalensis]ODN70981.1 hypothetical protein A6302_01682 [Methylobrevis pamukkalensis]